ncbi:flavin reductase family protein [Bacillus solitudinis]|uniref:flavin reductase family protein n=1 Tax=Bacillus solitudinis TaxID=2014074 RepID=UPI000C243DBE|nr:flavin reductase family protein [Bacillus solitudinis]
MIFSPTEIESKNMYKLLTGAVVPRPIAWVSTKSDQGILNIAPFSFFTVASSNPATLCFSVGPGAGGEKDTLANIRDTEEFVINIVSTDLANAMHKSAEAFPPDIDEFKEAGLTPVKSEAIDVPRVEEAPINIECSLDRIIPVGDNHLVLGKVVHFHIKDECYLGDFKVNLEKVKPLGRLAGNYTIIEKQFSLPHLDVNGLFTKK